MSPKNPIALQLFGNSICAQTASDRDLKVFLPNQKYEEFMIDFLYILDPALGVHLA